MQLRFGLPLALLTFSMVGCHSISLNNGSLDYKEATSTDTLKYPEGTVVRPATPLYPAPVIDPQALENAPSFANTRGNRFAMPRPNVAPQAPTLISEGIDNTAVGRPQLLTDGNGNPLLKVEGNSATTWQYTLATLSSLNLNSVPNGKNPQEVSIKIEGKSYVLKLTAVGSSNTLAVFDTQNNFADKEKAADLLTQIYQNWPA